MTLRERLRRNPIIVFLYWLPVRFFLIIARFFPLQNKIVFDNFRGKGLGNDPKYILLQLIKDGVKAKYIWLLNDFSEDMPKEVKKIQYGSWKATYHYLTAKVWIDDVKSNPKPKKRKGQFYLQTWHGSFGIKKVEQAVESILSPDYVKLAKKDSEKTDLMYANHTFQQNLFKTSFWYKGNVIRSGLPRLSIIIHPTEQTKATIYESLKIPSNKKIILYAPTFRKDNCLDPYLWDYHLILSALRNKFKEDFILLIRLHPNISIKALNYPFSDEIIDATSYPDMDELMSVAQIMITDFSGTLIDIAITHKPVFIFAKDFYDYLNNDRGQCFPVEELPFPIATTENEFLTNIEKFDIASFNHRTSTFFEKIGLNEDGCGARNIADIVINQLKKQ